MTVSNHPSINQHNTSCADKHKCKPCNTNDQVNEIIGQTLTPKPTKSETEDKDPLDFDSLDSKFTLLQTQNDYHKLIKLLRSNQAI